MNSSRFILYCMNSIRNDDKDIIKNILDYIIDIIRNDVNDDIKNSKTNIPDIIIDVIRDEDSLNKDQRCHQG